MMLQRLVSWLIFRSFREERFLTALTIIGVTLGVALFASVKTASDRASDYFEADTMGLIPAATHEIVDMSGSDFDETIYGTLLQKAPGVFLPVMRTDAVFAGDSSNITILGVDALKSRPYVPDAPLTQMDANIFTAQDGVLVPSRFATMHGVTPGMTVVVQAYDKTFRLTVTGLYDTGKINGNTFLMDIGVFQELFGMQGVLSRIDWIADNASPENVAELLPAGLSLSTKDDIVTSRKGLIASFRHNLQFVSLIAMLVGLFLLYNTIVFSVVKRRPEIAILRGLGATRTAIVSVFVIYGLLIGVAGSLLGIAVGHLFSIFAIKAVSTTLTVMYGNLTITETGLSYPDMIWAFLLGTTATTLASLLPAIEAARTKPALGMREGGFEQQAKLQHTRLAFTGLFLMLAGGAITTAEYYFTPFSVPYLSWFAIFLILVGAACIAPRYLEKAVRILKPRMSGENAGAVIVARNMIAGSSTRFSAALMSLVVSITLIVSMLVLIYSFRTTLKDWVDTYLRADIYVKSSSCTSNFCQHPLSLELRGLISGIDGVERVSGYRTISIVLNGQRIMAGFTEYDKRYDKLSTPDSSNENIVYLSEYFRLKYGLDRGSIVQVQTPDGIVPFTVEDVFPSYSTTDGFALFSIDALRKYWDMDEPTQLSITLEEGADKDAVLSELDLAVSGKYSLNIQDSTSFRQSIMDVFDRSFSITYAIELIAFLVSIIGIVNTQLSILFERKRELSVLRYVGADWRQIRSQIVVSAGAVSFFGILPGVALGLMVGIILIKVVNKISFGWLIIIQIPWLWILFICVMLFVAAGLAGWIPAAMARSIDPKRFISYE